MRGALSIHAFIWSILTKPSPRTSVVSSNPPTSTAMRESFVRLAIAPSSSRSRTVTRPCEPRGRLRFVQRRGSCRRGLRRSSGLKPVGRLFAGHRGELHAIHPQRPIPPFGVRPDAPWQAARLRQSRGSAVIFHYLSWLQLLAIRRHSEDP